MRVLILVLAFSTLLWAESPPDTKQIEAIFSKFDSADAPGCAVLVKKGGRILHQRGYGVADLQSRHKLDERSNFRLASVSKQFTAAAVMLLVRDGRLRYEDRLTDIFPDFPPYGKMITIRNLLNHTSGLLDYEDLMPKTDPNLPIEQVQIHDSGVLQLLKQQKTTKFVPGTHWDYSNSGYVLLGEIVAKRSGKSFDEFLRDRIFLPLGMNDTVAFVAGKNEVAHRVYGHTKTAAGWKQTDQSPTSATIGDGGIYSSLQDLSKWDDGLRYHTLLSAAQMRPALVPVELPDRSVRGPDGAPAAYGFGWFLNPYKQHPRMWHYGETEGFRTNVQRFTEGELTVVVLCNRVDLDPGAMGLRVADLYLGH